jgi:hypothetical protein
MVEETGISEKIVDLTEVADIPKKTMTYHKSLINFIA